MKPMGEGILLGGVIAVAVIGSMLYIGANHPPRVTVTPIHSVDVVVTRKPPVNINTAGIEELSGLPGIGEAIAGRIIERRETSGPFESADELLEISGIGEAKLEGIREDIFID